MLAHADTQEDRTSEVVPDVVPKAPWRVAEVRVLAEYRLWVRFIDGLEGTVDMAGLIRSSRAGAFAVLSDESLFAQAFLCYGAVTWPGELDLAPDAMHEAIRRDGEWVLS
jgi:hypothetical protein